MENTALLTDIYNILVSWQPTINLITGLLQFSIVVFSCYILYKLFNLFF